MSGVPWNEVWEEEKEGHGRGVEVARMREVRTVDSSGSSEPSKLAIYTRVLVKGVKETYSRYRRYRPAPPEQPQSRDEIS